MKKNKNKNAQILGQKGGKKTLKTYGIAHYSNIGRSGSIKRWENHKKKIVNA